MSGTHPNALLILALTPDDLSRKTYRAIMEEEKIEDEDSFKIGKKSYHHMVMENDYDKDNQISAKEGDIILWDLVTYGYGEVISWKKLDEQKQALEEWAKKICEQHHCNYEIFISANYW